MVVLFAIAEHWEKCSADKVGISADTGAGRRCRCADVTLGLAAALLILVRVERLTKLSTLCLQSVEF